MYLSSSTLHGIQNAILEHSRRKKKHNNNWTPFKIGKQQKISSDIIITRVSLLLFYSLIRRRGGRLTFPPWHVEQRTPRFELKIWLNVCLFIFIERVFLCVPLYSKMYVFTVCLWLHFVCVAQFFFLFLFCSIRNNDSNTLLFSSCSISYSVFAFGVPSMLPNRCFAYNSCFVLISL